MCTAKRLLIAFIMLAIMVTGSTVAWLVYYGNFPKKVPLRAKQVISIDVNYTNDGTRER
jgi:hypothetical protein